MKINSGQAPSTLIPEYIGSDFDKVIEVADNIEYVKDVAAGIEGLPVHGYIGETPPLQPLAGAEWYCTTDGRTYVWYKDDDSGQWVESSPQSTVETDPSIAHTVVTNTANIFALWKRSAAEAGLNLVTGSFEEGGILTSSTDVLLHKESKSIYAWSGTFPVGGKVVVAGSTPAPLGSGGWIDRSDVTLRDDLAGDSGYTLVGGVSRIFPTVREMLDSELVVGRRYQVIDFYDGVKGGGGVYTACPVGTTVNGFTSHAAANSVVAVLECGDSIDIQQCGAKPQNDKRWNELVDAGDAWAAIDFAFKNFKKVTGTGRYLVKGVLRTPQRYSGAVYYDDDYRWTLEGDGYLEFVIDLTVVPALERGNGWAVGFGLSHKDYTKPAEWENGSSIYNGLQRNITIRNVNFWNRNWTSALRDAEALEKEIGVGIFAGENIKVENVVVWGFKANFVTTCWASHFSNVRPRDGEYGFVPYAGTTIVGDAIFAGSNKHAISTKAHTDWTTANPVTYGLTLNCPASDFSREIGIRLDDVYGCVLNVPSVEEHKGDGIYIGRNTRSIKVNGIVTTNAVAGAGYPIVVDTLDDKCSVDIDVAINSASYNTVAINIVNDNAVKTTKLNVRGDTSATHTNRTAQEVRFMSGQDYPYFRYTATTPANNNVSVPLATVQGMALEYGKLLDYAYSHWLFDIVVKVNDGTNFFLFYYDLDSYRPSGTTRSYKLNLARSVVVTGGSIPTMNASVAVSGADLVFTFAPSAGTWNIIGLELHKRATI